MKSGLSRELIALRVAKELKDGYYVNLGFGLPTLVSNFLPEGVDVILHAENGILGYGCIATEEDIDTAMTLSRNWTAGPFGSRKRSRASWH